MKVVMIGADRRVKGGVSAVVNNLYQAGLDKRVDLTYIGTMVDGGRAKKARRAAAALLQFLFALPGADLVHVNMAADASCYRKILFMKAAKLFHKKIVLHEHGGDFQGFYENRCSERARRIIRKTLNKADLFLVLSEEWKQFFSGIVDPAKIHVLENCVPAPDKEKTDYSSHQVLFLGRLCREKGIGELLSAVPEIKKEVPDFKLILGGFWEKGNEALKKKAEALRDTVECPGWVRPVERAKLFETCSIFVLPTWFEGQPVSLLEAMAAGLCVTASAVGGIPQILEAGTAALPAGWDGPGVLMEPQNAHMLAQVLVRLLKDQALREKIGMRARARVCGHYNIDGYVDRLMEFYDMV